jgi:hypothetical protein
MDERWWQRIDERYWHCGLPPASSGELMQARIEEMYAREAAVADRARFQELEEKDDEHCDTDSRGT